MSAREPTQAEEARERLRVKMQEAFRHETEARDTYADGYASGLAAAVQELDRVRAERNARLARS